MKLSILAAVLLLSNIIQNVQADTDYFNKPVAASSFSPCQQVDFLLDKIDNDEDQIILAQLYKHEDIHKDEHGQEEENDDDDDDDNSADAAFVKTIRMWRGDDIGDENSDFSFSWIVPASLANGKYHVQIETKRVGSDTIEQGDTTRSRTFTILPNPDNTTNKNRCMRQ